LLDKGTKTVMKYLKTKAVTGSAKANGREPKSCLGRVFSFKFGCFVIVFTNKIDKV
jgi:hypothetical protein